MVPIAPGNPITKPRMIATLSLVSKPGPLPSPPSLLALLLGESAVVEVPDVKLCGIVVVVELAVELLAAFCADEDRLEKLDGVEVENEEEEEEAEEEEVVEEEEEEEEEELLAIG